MRAMRVAALVLAMGGYAEAGPLRDAAANVRITPVAAVAQAPASPQQPACRRGRRALLGAAIGAGASVPIAVFAHGRFENEARSGGAAAATAIVLGAAAGAFVGLSTCR